MDGKQVRKFTWKIENFSNLNKKKLYSDIFFVGGNKWRVLVFPKGNNVKQLSIFLDFPDSAALPHGWSRYAQFRLSVINQMNRENSTCKVSSHEFNAKQDDWGFTSFLHLSELHDPNKGYLMNDACLVEADVSTDRTIDLLSYEFIVESDSNELKAKEGDHGQDETESTNQELPTPQPSSPSETIEPEDPTEEDIDSFFTRLGSELADDNFDSSKEEAKEALAKIEEALNMAPANFYESGKFSPLKKEFKVLSSSDWSSALTIEQKTELLAMENSFKELSERIVKAMQDKDLLSEKESVKLTLSSNLQKSLSTFKESKAELKQVEQKIAALLEQLDEEQKNKIKILAGRKESFKTTKNTKMELEALQKEWPEYEAKAKADEEEENTVAAEWSRMKDFMSSLKERF